jgi:hypothetical protein
MRQKTLEYRGYEIEASGDGMVWLAVIHPTRSDTVPIPDSVRRVHRSGMEEACLEARRRIDGVLVRRR